MVRACIIETDSDYGTPPYRTTVLVCGDKKKHTHTHRSVDNKNNQPFPINSLLRFPLWSLSKGAREIYQYYIITQVHNK